MWLSWLGIVQQRGMSLVWLLIRAHAWIAGSVPVQGVYKSQPINVSLSHQCFSPSLFPSLPLSLKVNKLNIFLKIKNSPWLVWLSGLSASLKTEGSPVQFPVGAHAWVVCGSGPLLGVYKSQPDWSVTHRCFSPSLSPSRPPKINLIIFFKN